MRVSTRASWTLAIVLLLGTCNVQAETGQVMTGEVLGLDAHGPGIVESMEEALAREAVRIAEGRVDVDKRSRNGAQGEWVVPSRGATYYPHSGEHNVVNKWGDTRMGIGFPGPVDVDGAYFAGQAGEGAWANGIKVIGYRDGQKVGETDWFREINREPKWFGMGLKNVDRIEITSTPVLQGGGWFGMDDLTFRFVSANGGLESDVTVVDFEDVSFQTTLTGTQYAGLTWEMGSGDFSAEEAIHHPVIPQDYLQDWPAPSGPAAEAQSQGGGGTAPILDFDFTGPKRGDAGSSSFPPDTMGAVGPNHLVVTINRSFTVYNKNAGQLQQMNLGSFMPGSNGDPRVLFDQHSGRWVVIVSDFSSRIYLAVSLTDDPTGSWFKTNFVAASGSDAGKWPDYPTLGVDANGIYTACYMVGGNNRMTIFAIDKAPLIAGSPSLGTVTAFRELPWEGAIQPVHTYGNPAGQYFVSRAGSASLRIRRLNPPLSAPTLSELGLVSIPSHSFPPDAPAMGASTPLDTVGHRLMMALYRDGAVWTTHAVGVNTRSAVRWYQFGPESRTLMQSGTVSDPSLHYFFPSIAVNLAGNVVLAFSGSSSTTFPSVYYVGRQATDPADEMSAPQLMHAGTASQNLIDSQGRNRFGDYSQTTVDPADGSSIWTVQEFNSSTNIWAMRIGRFVDEDCNNNEIPDPCDVHCIISGCNVPGCGGSDDCNNNFVPDECEPDCNSNNQPDDCDVFLGTVPDCNNNSNPDDCDILQGTAQDCNNNGIPDQCDITAGVETDCDGSGVPDGCELASDPTLDCQPNGVFDACDIDAGTSLDADLSGVPDECEIPCNSPVDCDDGEGCTTDICNPNNFCRWELAYDPVTTCCALGVGTQTPIEDGLPCTIGSCDPGTGIVTQTDLPDGPAEGCGGGDPCSSGGCQSGTCVTSPKTYGDVDGNGTISLFDLFCVLDAFADRFTNCSFDDVDIEPCSGNGAVNLLDLFAVLDAFSDVDPCCP